MKKKKIKKLKYSNIILASLIALLIILLIITSVMVVKVLKDTLGKSTINGVTIIDTMEKYDYKLTEKNTDYFKKLYYELKELLEKEPIDDQEYAILIGKLFVTDFYDLNSKLNKTDVGGIQFVYSPYRESFQKYASDSTGIYYYVENNIYGDRKQKLPIIKEVELIRVDSIKYGYENKEDANAYKINLQITYKENMGYPTNVELILLHNKNRLEIVEMN